MKTEQTPTLSLQEFVETYFPETINPNWHPDQLRVLMLIQKSGCNFSSARANFNTFRRRVSRSQTLSGYFHAISQQENAEVPS